MLRMKKQSIFMAALLFVAPVLHAQTVRDGITIPATHPAWYWTPARIATAAAWVTAVGYPGRTTNFRLLDPEDIAFSCLVMNNSTACAALVTFATGATANPGACTGNGSDQLRWVGEGIMNSYDWGFSQLSSGQRSTIFSQWDTCLTNQDAITPPGWGEYGQGGRSSMTENNYFWGDYRVGVEFGASMMNEGSTAAGTHLDADLGTAGGAYNSSRWNNLINHVQGSSTQLDAGGFDIHGIGYAGPGMEGFGEYGRYMLHYEAQPLVALGVMGRRLESESNHYYSAVYMTIYNTVFDTSYRGGFEYFPFSDDEDYFSGMGCSAGGHNGYANGSTWTSTDLCLMQSQYFGDFMQAAVNEFPTVNAGKHARAWLNAVHPGVSPIFASLDANPAPIALTGLPLDYANSEGFLWSRDNWNDLSARTATQCLFQGNSSEPGTGHFHQDAGNFECYRHGIPIIRETVDYNNTIAGYADSGTVGSDLGVAHNVGLVNGVGSSATDYAANGLGVLLRRESQTGYSFEAVNLQPVYNGGGSHPNSEVSTYVREFIEFRGIPALVIVDRWTAAHTNDTTTFLTHCLALPTENTGGTYYTDTCISNGQEAFYTSLVPAHPSQAIVHESDNSATTQNPQYRIESNNASPGNVLSYQIFTVQLGDSAGFSALTPSVVDSNSGDPTSGTFTITLDANNSLVINKGATSSGGTIKAAGVSNSLTSTVEAMTVSASGPVWANSQATPGPSGVNAGWLP